MMGTKMIVWHFKPVKLYSSMRILAERSFGGICEKNISPPPKTVALFCVFVTNLTLNDADSVLYDGLFVKSG